MQYSKHVLSNGLRIITIPMPSLESATIAVWVKTGSRNETSKISGISHFLEHMVFKGSKKRPSAKAISEVVDSIGGEFNAATSKDWTNFYIKASTQHLETAMDVLSDMVLCPILDEREMEREKGTIVEEIKMYEDTPMYRIGDVFEELIYEGHPLGVDTIGSEKTVKGMTRNDFLRYRKSYYYPENIIVTVAGGVSKQKVIELGKKYFGSLKKSKDKKSQGSGVFIPSQKKPKLKLHSKKKEQAHFIMGFLADGREYKGKFAQSVLSVILGSGMSSRLFIEVRERRGLAYSVRTSMDRYQEVGYLGTYAGVDPKRVDQAIKVTLEEHYKLASGEKPVTKEELSKAKEYLKGHLALALEDTKDVASFFGEQELFLKEVLTPKEMLKKVDEVTLEDINDEAKRLFVPERLNLAIIGPYDSEDGFKKLLF